MKQLAFAVVAALSLLAAPSFAADKGADKGHVKSKLTEEVKLQENRASELKKIGDNDITWGKDLEAQAKALETHAQAMEDRAKEFRTLASALDAAGAKELDGFAAELETYAKHDREGAASRRKIGVQIIDEGKQCLVASNNHKEEAGKLKALAGKIK